MHLCHLTFRSQNKGMILVDLSDPLLTAEVAGGLFQLVLELYQQRSCK